VSTPIPCDSLSLDSWDSGRQTLWFSQEIPSGDARIGFEGQDEVYWENHRDCHSWYSKAYTRSSVHSPLAQVLSCI
jgi:hypothetical protein